MKIYFLALLLAISTPTFSQDTIPKVIDKELLSANWMVSSLTQGQEGKRVTRLEMRKDPIADFIITSEGNYNVSFENVGKGTWRLEGDIVIFWGKDFDTGRPKLEAVYKILTLEEEKLTLKLLWMTKYYDWEIELVPFN